MSAQIERYAATLKDKIDDVVKVNADALDRAAELCAAALAVRQVIHIYDTGHIISHELINRTGGLVAYTHLSFNGALENRNLWRSHQRPAPATPEEALRTERALIEWVFGQGTLQSGDILVIGSVSGVGMRLVELALQAQARGLKVIAVTSTRFSGQLDTKHPSGKHLFEVADVVLDNLAEYGDSFFTIPGIGRKVAPLSGLSATVLMWSLTVGIVERLAAQGLEPSIYESVNLPDGPASVTRIEAAYEKEGL